MGWLARALTGLACKRRGKSEALTVGARDSMGDSRAPFRASPIVAEKTRPQGCKPQDISERTARKAIKQGSPSLITKVFATHRVDNKPRSSYRLKLFVEM